MKTIILTDLGATLREEQDLYTLYNDFLIDADMEEEEVDSVVEEIRDNYSLIFEMLPNYMNCDLETFENVVMQFILI